MKKLRLVNMAFVLFFTIVTANNAHSAPRATFVCEESEQLSSGATLQDVVDEGCRLAFNAVQTSGKTCQQEIIDLIAMSGGLSGVPTLRFESATCDTSTSARCEDFVEDFSNCKVTYKPIATLKWVNSENNGMIVLPPNK